MSHAEKRLEMNATKEQITNLLYNWINQRPGLDFADYGDVSAYRSEARGITQDRRDALTLLRAVELSGITAQELADSFRAYSGRLSIHEDNGEYRIEYCTGQYWPTEYRAAACAVLANALWDYHNTNARDAKAIQAKFRRMFGRGIQQRWFD